MAGRVSTYRREASRVLRELSEPQLRVARDFLAYLRMKEEDDPTLEILANPSLTRDVRAARRDLARGRRSAFVAWERVKRE